MKLPRRANVITGGLFTASAAILIGVVYFAMNIEVIKDWTLTLPNQDIHTGDTIVVASRYMKLKQVKGTSQRSIECQSTPGIFVSYPLNKVTANRAAGKTGTGIIVTIPTKMAGINNPPDTCHICVALSYPVLPGRNVPYFKCTKNFTLLPEPVNQTSTAESQSPSSVSNLSYSYPSITSLPNNTANPSPEQSDTSQPQESTPTPTPDPTPQPTADHTNILEQLIAGVRRLI